MDFLIDVFYDEDSSFNTVKHAATFVRSVKKLSGESISQSDWMIIDKFLSGAFNEKPPIRNRQSKECWDVNIILNFIVNLGNNDTMLINELGGKAVILTLLTTMCRLSDVQQLTVSNMLVDSEQMTFVLTKPTKTFNKNTYTKHPGLQELCLKRFKHNELLCPVKCLLDYIKRTKEVRMGLDKVFVIMGPFPKEAKHATISRWAKNLMSEAGLGDFSVRSARSASSTCTLLMGMPLRDIISHAGWTNESIFIRTYLKPLGKISKEQLNPKYRTSQARACLNDKFGITKCWENKTPRSKPKSVRLVSAAKSVLKASKLHSGKQSGKIVHNTTRVLKKKLNRLSHAGSKNMQQLMSTNDIKKRVNNCAVCPVQNDHDKQSTFRKQYIDPPHPPVDVITSTVPPTSTTSRSLITFGTQQMLDHQSADFHPEIPPHPTPQTDRRVCTFVGRPWTRIADKSDPSSFTTETIPPPPKGGESPTDHPQISSEFRAVDAQDTQVTVDISDLDLEINTPHSFNQTANSKKEYSRGLVSLDFWDSIERLDVNDLSQVIQQVEYENNQDKQIESNDNQEQQPVWYPQEPKKQVKAVKKVSEGTIQLLKDHIQQKYAKNRNYTREVDKKDKQEGEMSSVEKIIIDNEIIDQSDNFSTVGSLIKGKFRTNDNKLPSRTAKQALRDHILKIKYEKELQSENKKSSALDTSVKEESHMVFTRGRLTYDARCALLKDANERSKSSKY